MWPFDQILDAVNALIEVIAGIGYLIFYPVIVFVNTVYLLAAHIIDTFYILFNNFMTIPTILTNLLYGTIGLALPVTMVVLLIGLVFIVVALRIYSFVKDISIFGFKI